MIRVGVTVLAATLAIAACGSDSAVIAGPSGAFDSTVPTPVPDGGTTVRRLARFLPEGFDPQMGDACIYGDKTAPTHSFLLFRDDRRRETEERQESAFLRIFTADTTRPFPETGEFMTLASIVDDIADADSTYPTEVQGFTATGFELTSAEPVSVAWPALAWQDDLTVIWLVGEGMTTDELKAVAEALEPVSPEEFNRLAPATRSDICGMDDEDQDRADTGVPATITPTTMAFPATASTATAEPPTPPPDDATGPATPALPTPIDATATSTATTGPPED